MLRSFIVFLLVTRAAITSAAPSSNTAQATSEVFGAAKIVEYLADNIYLLVAFGATWLLVEVARFLYRKVRSRSRLLRDLQSFFHLDSEPAIHENRIMLVGKGGSGKSSLINAITDPTKIGEEAETDGYLSIKYSFTRGDDIFRFTFFDYRGQNSGTLARGVKDNSHSDTKELNSIVFVVDLMPPERKYREDNSKALDLHVKTRLRAHVDEWSSPTLDTIFGFFDQEELRYVCLYINTVDKIRDNAAHIKSDIKEELAPMIARLRKRCGYKDDGDTLGEGFAKFDILFGSARSGLSVLKLKSELMKHSVISG